MFKKSAMLAAAFCFGVAAPAGAQDTQEFSGTFAELNDSGASGDFTVTLNGTTGEFTINVNGVADQVHPQHIHGEVAADNVCPTAVLDADGDGLINTVEGVPAYGLVKVSLTTEGDSTPDSALAVERFPTATGNSYSYSNTIELPADIAGDLGNMNIIVHGFDIDESGAYDGDAVSSLDPSLPLEATVPIACGKIVLASATPTGGVAAGAGGTAPGGDAESSATGALLVAAALVAGGASLLVSRRRQA